MRAERTYSLATLLTVDHGNLPIRGNRQFFAFLHQLAQMLDRSLGDLQPRRGTDQPTLLFDDFELQIREARLHGSLRFRNVVSGAKQARTREHSGGTNHAFHFLAPFPRSDKLPIAETLAYRERSIFAVKLSPLIYGRMFNDWANLCLGD